MNKIQKAILIIMDGWGLGKHDISDAIYNADTPFIDSLYKSVPNSQLLTYGLNVGLPSGQMGNSEVGHLNIGAGRIVYQMLTRIDKAFADREVEKIAVLRNIIEKAKAQNKKIHLIGLVSDGGVHSSMEHLINLCEILKNNGLDNQTFIHAFTDGRDTDPKGGLEYLKNVMTNPKIGRAKIASCIGRYYAMDRDKRWERIKLAYDLLTAGVGKKTTDLLNAINESYKNEVTDEFLMPISLTNIDGKPLAIIEDGDIVINFNFRTDRGREITLALTQKDFPLHEMKRLNLDYTTFTEYDKTYENVRILFENDDLNNTLGEMVSKNNLRQIRAAETEKYPHVTFFFSGGREKEFANEKRIMIPSPKVATYDLQPEMSAIPLKDAILKEIEMAEAEFMCINFANADMVGHTGVYPSIVKAVEIVDSCVKQLVEAGLRKGYQFVIIADHGNADHALNDNGTPNTAHSMNPVPCFLVGNNEAIMNDGILADIAPTILKIMGLQQPIEMTGKTLF
ncbi:MAG: 2,3-bisphosphoglycerate-independent phosphoglycerate mutase [Bacteroidia bacterium]